MASMNLNTSKILATNMRRGMCSDHPLVSVIYDLINPEFQCNKKVIVCGRPQASESIYHAFESKTNMQVSRNCWFRREKREFVDRKVFPWTTPIKLTLHKTTIILSRTS